MISIGYRPDLLRGQLSGWLDHFRWVAALMVAVAHLRNAIFPDAFQLPKLAVPFYFFSLFGTQSVVIFFVISGLLVGGVVLRDSYSGAFDFSKFGFDRAVRLYIVLLPAVALSIVLQKMVGAVDCQQSDGIDVVAANLLFLQNFAFYPLCNNHPLWSLSSEAYFYVAGTIVIFATIQRSKQLFLLSIAGLLPALFYFTPDHGTPLFGIVLWFIGMMPWFIRVRLPFWLVSVPFLIILLLSRVHFFPSDIIGDLLIAFSFTLILCANFSERTVPFARWGKVLSGFSYSLYLVHMPIVQAAAYYIGFQSQNPAHVMSYIVYIFVLLAIIVVSYAFGFLFESRTGDVKRWLRKRFLSQQLV